MPTSPHPSSLVGVVMGSKSDWETMRHAEEILNSFDVPNECRILSAHRTPQRMAEYAAASEERGLEVIIAGAGGAAHLPGMMAAQTPVPWTPCCRSFRCQEASLSAPWPSASPAP